jgi:GNAT superfamily N-acetyltransferase
MNVEIREFLPQDAAAVSGIIRSTLRVTNGADYSPEILEPLIEYFSPEKVLQLAGERMCLVAEIDAQIVGTVALENSELQTFFVRPDFQRKHVGTFLLKNIERFARGSRIKKITVFSSLTAVSFYEKMGYRKTGFEQEKSAGRQIGMEKTLKN